MLDDFEQVLDAKIYMLSCIQITQNTIIRMCSDLANQRFVHNIDITSILLRERQDALERHLGNITAQQVKIASSLSTLTSLFILQFEMM